MDELVKKLRSRAWEDRQHRQLREAAATRIEHLEAALDWLMEFLSVEEDYGPTDDAEIAAIIKAVQKRSPLSANAGQENG